MAAFVAVHATYRAVKQFTSLGQIDTVARLNFTPGLVMIVATLTILLVSRQRFSSYGLTLRDWRECVKIGFFCGLLVIAGAGVLFLFGMRNRAGGVRLRNSGMELTMLWRVSPAFF